MTPQNLYSPGTHDTIMLQPVGLQSNGTELDIASLEIFLSREVDFH